MPSFTKKQIEIRLTLSVGKFAGGGNTKIINGLATSTRIKKPGLPDKNGASIVVFGMKPDDMASFTTLNFRPLQVEKNHVQILTGEDDGPLSIAFSGEVTSAFADYNASPDIAFRIEALSGYYPSITPAAPSSFNGNIAVSDIISSIAKDIGYQFENFGVTASLLNPILNGSPIEKCRTACRNAGVQLFIDDNRLRIANANGNVGIGPIGVLSAETGMIGYPTFGADGIKIKALYNSDVELGGLIRVRSIVPRASGQWKITKLEHALEANMPGMENLWETSMEAAYGDKT